MKPVNSFVRVRLDKQKSSGTFATGRDDKDIIVTDVSDDVTCVSPGDKIVVNPMHLLDYGHGIYVNYINIIAKGDA